MSRFEYNQCENYKNHYHREHHPRVSLGIFFIMLGLALLVATNDLLGLGSVSSYFTWETVLVFIGFLLILNLHFTGGLILIATGIWFLQDRISIIPHEIFSTFYWPALIIIVGLSFILSYFFRRRL